MAGGPNTAEMVSTVANLGAVGSYGFAYSVVEDITRDLAAAKNKRKANKVGALNANFFIFNDIEEPDAETIETAIKCLRQSSENNIEPRVPRAPYFPDVAKQLEPVWDNPPDILTFHFGIPEPAILAKAHSLDIAVGITATCNDEATQIENSGADFIVSQGIEAGGHRGIFDPQNDDTLLTCFELIKSLTTVTSLPLVAAGGIMNGGQIKQALALGASAVQMGTAFLTTSESGASPAHKHYLLEKTDRTAEITLGFSGRPARGVNNRFIEYMISKPVLPFPLQNSLTGKLRAAALANNDGEFQSLWAGSNFSECRQETIEALVTRLFD